MLHSGQDGRRLCLLVGERANIREWCPRGEVTDDKRERLMTAMSAFEAGSAKPLVACGVEWDHALNLCWPAPQSVPYDWDEAAENARVVRERVEPLYCLTVLAGAKVQKLFGYQRVKVPSYDPRSKRLLVPHPSGLCRAWNDVAVREEVAALWFTAKADSEYSGIDWSLYSLE